MISRHSHLFCNSVTSLKVCDQHAHTKMDVTKGVCVGGGISFTFDPRLRYVVLSPNLLQLVKAAFVCVILERPYGLEIQCII